MTSAAKTTSSKVNKGGKGGGKKDDVLWPRQVAFNLLRSFWQEKKFLDALFESNKDFLDLDTRNRNFVRMLVTTCVRRHGQIDDIMRRSFKNPKQKLSPDELRFIFYLGIAQIVFMAVADHAAVNSSVELASRNGAKFAKGFVNAALRKIIRDGKGWTTTQDIARLNTPDWLLDCWSKDYGKAVALDIAQANSAEASLDITVRDPIDRDQLAETLDAKILPNGTLRRLDKALVSELPEYDQGSWWVQDISASLPVKLAGDLLHKKGADICAAPGGKTLQLAHKGMAKLFAIDRSATRMKRLQENIQRSASDKVIDCVVEDAALWKAPEPLDFILLDAPCTASGTLRRNPDMAWLKQPSDINTMVKLQRKILDNAAKMLKPEGVIIYCTCSLQKAEGEGQVDAFLADNADFERMPVQSDELAELEQAITDKGDVRILPYYWAAYGGMDGFFISRLIKKAA